MNELLDNLDIAEEMLSDLKTKVLGNFNDEEQIKADLEAIILHIKYTKERT